MAGEGNRAQGECYDDRTGATWRESERRCGATRSRHSVPPVNSSACSPSRASYQLAQLDPSTSRTGPNQGPAQLVCAQAPQLHPLHLFRSHHHPRSTTEYEEAKPEHRYEATTNMTPPGRQPGGRGKSLAETTPRARSDARRAAWRLREPSRSARGHIKPKET